MLEHVKISSMEHFKTYFEEGHAYNRRTVRDYKVMHTIGQKKDSVALGPISNPLTNN